MNDAFEFFIAFALTVGFVGTPQPHNEPSELGPKVLLVGDSNVGTGLAAEMARIASLRARPWRIVMHSVSGSGMFNDTYWVPHLRALCNAERPELLILNLGANDAGAGVFPERWTELPALALELAGLVRGGGPDKRRPSAARG